jgi:hypothetical protein
MKFAAGRPYADPEAAARKLIDIANSVEAVQDGQIYIELINAPMLFEHKATPAEYRAGLKMRSSAAGSGLTGPGPMSGSPSKVRICSLETGRQSEAAFLTTPPAWLSSVSVPPHDRGASTQTSGAPDPGQSPSRQSCSSRNPGIQQ